MDTSEPWDAARAPRDELADARVDRLRELPVALELPLQVRDAEDAQAPDVCAGGSRSKRRTEESHAPESRFQSAAQSYVRNLAALGAQ